MAAHFGWSLRLLRRFVRLFLPKYQFNGEDLPDLDQPTIFVSHHENLKGPLRLMVWTPVFMRPWVFAKLTQVKSCYRHFSSYTFHKRFGLPKALSKCLAWPTARISVFFLKSARSIPVYRQSKKIRLTFKESVASLQAGQPIAIFPDIDYQNSDQSIGELYEGFLTIDQLYYKKYGQRIQFIPLVANKYKKEFEIGRPLRFTGRIKFRKERELIAQALQDELNRLSSPCQEELEENESQLSLK
ncbi:MULTISPECIES: hypothetical protein [Aerococcus]|uniref:Glycerol acyltransferase n=1 Tax=Aerococcus sanguinicola TaxID=119206 RepID=A0A5N1GHC4_9LACT|nr:MULTISPECIES: hypothetical protein [Aerococcus]KAA9300377.1 glycerol acyltransferase [Aerococcus sanguinicola]MDK6368964.1 hypothetical protein [Aerococcus sp. UMB9870]MDK6678867.1 hypothetical protein [Aerococcus sp. UMB8608]MDK6686815.1 hypothetical protein [Aerococcus sp. UMB8623]MDK6939525.1 hypothetical protein [Aerococcus sp. UMB8487]